MKLMFFYELVNSNIEMQMSLCYIPTVNSDYSTINIQPLFENIPVKKNPY